MLKQTRERRVSFTGTTKWPAVLTAVIMAAALLMPCSSRADVFDDAATNPAFMRDVHLVGAGGSRTGSARTNNGQTTGISSYQAGVAANIWNNEHNQVLAGIQYGRRAFDRPIELPDGFAIPERLDNLSAALLYKHITSGDWSLSQSARYTRYATEHPSVAVKDTVDLVGLAAISPEPGIAWIFGYYYDQMSDTKNHFYPVIEYYNGAHDRWTITVGYPILSLSVSPHPYWSMTAGGGASIAYEIAAQNYLQLSYLADAWAYRLTGPEVKGVAYTAKRFDLGWTSLYPIDHRTVVVLSASVGWEFDRKLGADTKLVLDDAAVMGFMAGLSFY